MNDKKFNTVGWRDQAPPIHLKGDILTQIDRPGTFRRSRVLALGLVGSGLGAAALSAVFLMGSAPITLAQVLEADAKANSFTVVNRRIMGPEKGNGFTFTTKFTGDAVRNEVRWAGQSDNNDFGYRDKTQVVVYFSKYKLAAIDEPSKYYSLTYRRPEASKLLRDFKAAKVEKDYDWNGRRVTRFTYKASLRGTDIDQELLVDPKTSLPIKMTSMRDRRSWGDEWTYDYSKIDPKDIEPTYPSDTQVIDYREQRRTMSQAVSKNVGNIPLVEIGPYGVTILVKSLPTTKQSSVPVEISLSTKDGATKSFKGSFALLFAETLRISGKDFVAVRLDAMDLGWNDHWMGKTTTGSVKILGKAYSFHDVPVILTGTSQSMNEPFAINYRLAKPSKSKNPAVRIRVPEG